MRFHAGCSVPTPGLIISPKKKKGGGVRKKKRKLLDCLRLQLMLGETACSMPVLGACGNVPSEEVPVLGAEAAWD